MPILTEYAWILPIVAPFILGILTGILIKKIAKLALLFITIIVALTVFGYIQLPGFNILIHPALRYLPQIQNQASNLTNLLPYTTGAFLIGLAIGFWKG